MKYYLIAGEASGDLHGSNLIKHLKKLDDNATFRCWGGDKMESAGATLIEHFRNMAFMGFVEVIINIRTILGFFRKCKDDILQYKPDVLILIDYPGFNLRMAKWAKKADIKVVYYITPQVWAWHKSRVHILGTQTDLLLVILPFESAFFSKYGYKSTFVGHPLLDAIRNFSPNVETTKLLESSKEILALLPGSRKQEIKTMLPLMLEACRDLKFQVVIAGAPSIEDAIYHKIIESLELSVLPIIIRNQTYTLLSVSKYAMVSSGTATLETALFGIPQIVCYKGNAISYQIAKKLIDLKYISLVNLIADKEVVKELIQKELTPENLKKELVNLDTNYQNIKNDYITIRQLLGKEGASERAAAEIIKILT